MAGTSRLSKLLKRMPRRRPKRPPRGGEPEREPVEPNKPSTLSGGAAAELEFDD